LQAHLTLYPIYFCLISVNAISLSLQGALLIKATSSCFLLGRLSTLLYISTWTSIGQLLVFRWTNARVVFFAQSVEQLLKRKPDGGEFLPVPLPVTVKLK